MFGLFKKGGSSTPYTLDQWQDLTQWDQLDELFGQSEELPVLIFKHSTRCGVSRMALQGLEEDWDFSKAEIVPWFLDLLAHREISNEIARRWEVEHQSPQVILLHRGKVIYHDSHNAIDAEAIRSVLSGLEG